MKKVIMLRGLPASGKSTWAKDIVTNNNNYVRINKDDIRSMLGNKWSKEAEKLVVNFRDRAIESALIRNYNVIVDDTNFYPVHEQSIRQIAQTFNADFEIKEFNTPVLECIERDSLRGDKSVGKKVIYEMYQKYLAPHIARVKNEFDFFKNDMPLAIIVDIDGTLAHMHNRSPFDYSKVEDDYCDVIVRDVVCKYYLSNVRIIVVSGREDSCRKETDNWLLKNKIDYNVLMMRKTGDSRKDYIVKKEIYENEIKDKYNVLFVLDDRDQVVKMWREIGLKCLQVEDGPF